MTLIEELRSKKSRDNRALLDRAADRIEELEASHCERNKGKWEICFYLTYCNFFNIKKKYTEDKT